MNKSLYLKCAPGDLGSLALLTGDPARVDRLAALLEDAREVAQNREFYSVTGWRDGQQVSIVSSGIGAPSAAIALEEMRQLGVECVVRFGTTMGLEPPLGSIVLSSGAVRFEGTSAAYLPLEFPAVPDWQILHLIYQACLSAQLQVHVGLTATYDAFYPSMAPALVGRGLPDITLLQSAQVLGLDMETSLLYILGRRLGMAVASACVVTNSADPFSILATDIQHAAERDLAGAVFEALRRWKGRA